LPCLFEGQPHRYDVMFMVTNDIAFALGRETHGASKKMGNVMLEVRNEGVFGYAERPQGHRLLTVGVAPEQYIEPDPGSLNVVPSVSLRVIGQPAGCDPDVTMELIQTPAKWTIQEQWSGPGMIGFPESSAIDNWQVLPVKKIVGAFFSKVDIEIPLPNLLARL